MYKLLAVFSVVLAIHYSGKTGKEIQGNRVCKSLNKGVLMDSIIIPEGTSIKTRFIPPDDFARIPVVAGSFAAYLRNLPLKPHGSKVIYYDGSVKNTEQVYCAVVDMDFTKRDLQQCADAVIRLRAEFLYGKGNYEKIHFNFTSGDTAHFVKYAEGYRPTVSGNMVDWKKKTIKDYSYSNFLHYLDMVFMYAGSYSLEKELIEVEDILNMQIGDVLIQGGFPGHAVIVIDMAINPDSGEKKFLLAQSYMPAQDIQVLLNPADPHLNPWYSLNTNLIIKTPEWLFTGKDLKRFRDD